MSQYMTITPPYLYNFVHNFQIRWIIRALLKCYFSDAPPGTGFFLYFTIGQQGQTRFWRAEIRPYRVKPLDNTASILFGSFLVWPHFCTGKTALHLSAMNFRVIFVFWGAGGLAPVKAKRAKSAEKARCQAYLPLLIDGNKRQGQLTLPFAFWDYFERFEVYQIAQKRWIIAAISARFAVLSGAKLPSV